MDALIKQKRAPVNAVAPRSIVVTELFSLDVDDSIWDDIGLADGDNTTESPLWLCDEHVRTGIRGILLRDRCDEELLRLKYKQGSLKSWFTEELSVIVRSMEEMQGMSGYLDS